MEESHLIKYISQNKNYSFSNTMFDLFRNTETRAQQAEERAYVAESALKEAQERVRALERSLSRVDSSRETSTAQEKSQDE